MQHLFRARCRAFGPSCLWSALRITRTLPPSRRWATQRGDPYTEKQSMNIRIFLAHESTARWICRPRPVRRDRQGNKTWKRGRQTVTGAGAGAGAGRFHYLEPAAPSGRGKFVSAPGFVSATRIVSGPLLPCWRHGGEPSTSINAVRVAWPPKFLLLPPTTDGWRHASRWRALAIRFQEAHRARS